VTEAIASGTMPVVITIDVEPDHPWPQPGQRDPWLGFEAWIEYAGMLRDRLAVATGRPVKFNWALRMDDQISGVYGTPCWVAETYGPSLDKLRDAGDELGVHPHAWRWEDPPGRWLQDHDNSEWVATVIHTSFEAFRTSFGYDSPNHRFGSRFITPHILRTVRALGAKIDMTVEPGARGMAALEDSVPSTGYLPDQGAAPRVPYQPADDDPFRAATNDGATNDGATHDADGLWILPITAFDPGPWLSPSRRLARRVRFAGRPLHRPAELWAPAEPAAFWNLALESADDLPTPYLSLAVRSDCLIRPALSKPVKDKLEALFAGPWAERMAFTTPTEALRQLTGNE